MIIDQKLFYIVFLILFISIWYKNYNMVLFICYVNFINFNMLNDIVYLMFLNDFNIYRYIMSDVFLLYFGNQTKGLGNVLV